MIRLKPFPLLLSTLACCSLSTANPAIVVTHYRFAATTSGAVRADNAANSFSALFSGATTTIAIGSQNSRSAQITLSLKDYGWGSAMRASGPVTQTRAEGKRLDRDYASGLTEWFLNKPQGLEQGFVVARRGSGDAGSLRLRLAVAGGWIATQTATAVQFTRNGVTLEYGDLNAWDARGAKLHSHLMVSAAGIEIQVDDADAIYPVSIDPLISNLGQQQELTASDGAANDQFGYSVALSSDASTAVVGAYTKNNNVGAAYVYTGASGVWNQQQELTESDPGNFDFFGWSVAVSSDGNTALVGAIARNNHKGAAYVFTRSGGVWTQQQELTAADGTLFDFFGYSVALSGDGNTALISAPVKANAQGAAYVFTRSASSWSQQQKLTANDPANGDRFGYSVALSSDGSTALLGALNKNNAQGAAYVFNLSGTVWSQQQEFAPSDGIPGDQFGQWVALSGDGSTALFGVLNRAYVYSYSGAVWSQQQELTPSDAFYGSFGSTVALSSDGNIALLGAYQRNNSQGAAYVFTRDNSLWSQQQLLTASDPVNGDQFGWAVGLAGDGKSAVMGADFKNNVQGAAYIFAADTIPPTAAPVQSPLPNTAGWNRSDVLITWNWADNPGGSGVDPANCTNTSTSSGEGTVVMSATCRDLAGNVGNASFTVKVDKTNPTLTASGKNADNTVYSAGSWTNQTVTVSFACSDAVSGVATCPDSQVFPASTATASGTGSDVAGNSASATFGPIQIDRIPPTIGAALTSLPNAAGWYNANVAVRFTCLDADSGIPAGACPADQILTAEGTAVSSTGMTVHDAAGNPSAPSNVFTVMIDKTSPTVTYTGNLGTYGVDQTVSITCTATDALSGVALTTCSNISGPAYSLGVGSHSYSAIATDIAGNSGSGSTRFAIVVTFSGVTNLVYQWEGKSGKASALAGTLQSAQTAFASGDVATGDSDLNSFINQVSAQSGKSLTATQANLLIQYAQALME